MKQFTVLVCLSCLSVLAAAAPQGYKYQQNVPLVQTANLRPQTPLSSSGIYSLPPQQQHPVIQTVAPPVHTIVNTVEPQVQVQVQHQVQSQPQQQQIVYQQPQQQQQQQQFVPNIQQTQQQFVQTIQQPQQQFVQSQFVQRPSIVTKDIYIHSAPDETEEIHSSGPLDNVPIRKNYRIVFIKAPTQNLKHTAAALKRAQASNEEKTVIYVLSKKPDITEIQQHLQLSQTESKVHKPEVYFIKYKTTEEAQRAQQEIQAQYDALGGATHISDEGVAPITSFSGGSLNLGSIVPNHIHTQTIQQQPQTQTHVQTTQNVVGQGIQQQGSFVQQSGVQTTSLTSGGNFGVTAPSKRYIPAKAFK